MLSPTDEQVIRFLRARLDEAARAQQDHEAVWHAAGCETLPDVLYPDRETGACDCGVPAAVLRDVDVKRHLLDHLLPELSQADDSIAGEWGSDDDLAGKLLRALALAYAEHPDYNQEEWTLY